MEMTTQIELALGRRNVALARPCTDQQSVVATVLDDGRQLRIGTDVVLNGTDRVSILDSVNARFVLLTYQCGDIEIPVSQTRDDRIAVALSEARDETTAVITQAHADLMSAGVSKPVADILTQALGGVADAFERKIGGAIGTE